MPLNSSRQSDFAVALGSMGRTSGSGSGLPCLIASFSSMETTLSAFSILPREASQRGTRASATRSGIIDTAGTRPTMNSAFQPNCGTRKKPAMPANINPIGKISS